MNRTKHYKHNHNKTTEKPCTLNKSYEQRMQLLKETLQKRLDEHWPLKRLCDVLEQNLNM